MNDTVTGKQVKRKPRKKTPHTDDWYKKEIERIDRQIISARDRRNWICWLWYDLLHKGEE